MNTDQTIMTLKQLPTPGQRYGYCATGYASPALRSGIALAQMPFGQETFAVVLMDDGKVESVDLVATAGAGWKPVEQGCEERVLRSDKLPAAGSRIGYVDASVDHPAKQAGTVLAHVTHTSGRSLLALVLMDDGRTAYVDEVMTLDADFPFFSLGWYAV